MSDREALEAAILAEPDDDMPRLALADWLEENGQDQRAAFIRAQVALARVHPWDPLWVRTRHLEPEMISGEEWPLPEAPKPIQWDSGRGKPDAYRRGFPSVICVLHGAAFHDELARLTRIAPVDEVTWYGADNNTNPLERSLPYWAEVVGDSAFASVRRFKPALARLPEDDLRRLHDSPHSARLTELELETCEFTRGHAVTFFGLPGFLRLRKLGLHILEEGAGDVAGAAAGFAGHRLESLRLLCGSTLARSSLMWDTDLLSSPLCCGLKELDLSDHRVTGPNEARALVRSPSVVGLESLRLTNWKGGDDLAFALAGCAGLANLRLLTLPLAGIGPAGARALAESPYLANLRVLDLRDNPIGDEGAVAIADSPHLANLLDVSLLFCGVGDAGARAILDSPLTKSLVHLVLHEGRPTHPMGRRPSPITEAVARRLREVFGKRLVLGEVSK